MALKGSLQTHRAWPVCEEGQGPFCALGSADTRSPSESMGQESKRISSLPVREAGWMSLLVPALREACGNGGYREMNPAQELRDQGLLQQKRSEERCPWNACGGMYPDPNLTRILGRKEQSRPFQVKGSALTWCHHAEGQCGHALYAK